jgi:pyruvate carboxylase subunit B
MVQLHEMIFRDAHQSMLATRMRTDDMLPIAPKLDKVGFFSMEVWGGATFDVPLRYLNENPWDRLRKLKAAMPNTPLQMLERAMNIVAYRNFPDDVVHKFIATAKKNGCDYFRIFDAVNDLRNLKVPIEAVKKVGGHAQGALCYSISPVHTVERYVRDFKQLEKWGCDSIAIKDMAGMISPPAAYGIIKGCKDGGIKIPIDLHSHYTSGMTGMSYMRAAEAGVDIMDTAMSPISGGTAAPATESVVAALKGTEWDTGYDQVLLMEIRDYFLTIWDKYRHLHRMNAVKVDPNVTVHQIPGGMLSNLIFQLEEQGAGHKYAEILAETPRVKADFGHPPLVTPTSQIVGVQAVLNVISGERYKIIPKETKDYIRGMYGKPPAEISPEIYKKILGPKWKDEVIECRPADLIEPQFNKFKDDLATKGIETTDENVLIYCIYPEVGLKFLKGEAKAEFTSDQLPLKFDHPFTKAYVKAMFPEFTKEQLDSFGKVGGAGGPAQIPTEYNVEVNGEPYEVKIIPTGGFMVAGGGAGAAGVAAKGKGKRPCGDVPGGVKTTMQGTVLKIPIKMGDKIKKGDVVAVIEAMKMENDVVCDHTGEVQEMHIKIGDSVAPGEVLLIVK